VLNVSLVSKVWSNTILRMEKRPPNIDDSDENSTKDTYQEWEEK
jgi:hypothetical protein